MTFDDGFADTSAVALPILERHGLRATVFCVSGYVGASNDWPSQARSAPRLPLASAAALGLLRDAGWEIGAHGVDHEPLDRLARADVELQLRGSRETLEALLGTPVRSFAFPYGATPSLCGETLRRAGYLAACTTEIALTRADTSPLALPRVDAHYVRTPRLLARVLRGQAPGYLRSRRAAAGTRRRAIGLAPGSRGGDGR